jgi:hypothetical protein
MPIYTNTLPQVTEVFKVTTIQELVRALPKIIKYPINVWVGDKIACYGKTVGNLKFYTDKREIISTETKCYFNDLVTPLQIQATLTGSWKHYSVGLFQLYKNGELMLEQETCTYKVLPDPVKEMTFITANEIIELLPKEIKYDYTIWLTGGIVKNGFSHNDVDFIIFEPILDPGKLYEIKKYLKEFVGWNCDIGQKVMAPREPVYLFKLYEGGKLCQP